MVYERASLPAEQTTALCVRECNVCGEELVAGWSGNSCRICTNLDIMFPIDALARQQHRERFPVLRPPGMPPMMPREEPKTIRKRLRAAAIEAEQLRAHARAAATRQAAGKPPSWPFIYWKWKKDWMHWGPHIRPSTIRWHKEP